MILKESFNIQRKIRFILEEFKQNRLRISSFRKFLEVMVSSIITFGGIIYFIYAAAYYIRNITSEINFDALVTLAGIVITFLASILAILFNFFWNRGGKMVSTKEVREKEKVLYQNIQRHIDVILNKKQSNKEIPDSL